MQSTNNKKHKYLLRSDQNILTLGSSRQLIPFGH